MTDFPQLPQIQINDPCPKKWEELDGNQQQRFCDACEKNVFNFSDMTPTEVKAVLNSGHRVCARVAKNADGTVITRAEPRRRGFVSKLAGIAASMAAALTLAGCTREIGLPPPVEHGGATPVQSQQIMGEVCVLPSPDVDNQEALVPLLGRIAMPQDAAE